MMVIEVVMTLNVVLTITLVTVQKPIDGFGELVVICIQLKK